MRGRSEVDERVRVLKLTEQGVELKDKAKSVPNAMRCKITLEQNELISIKWLCNKALNGLA